MGIFKGKPSAAEQKKRELAEQKRRQGRRMGKDGKDQLGIRGAD